jgi:homoserine kinase
VLIEGLRDVGVPCALSGAGPSVLVVLPTGDDAALATVRERVSTLLADPDAVEVVPTAWHLSGASVCPPAQTFGPTS